jgi:hypothetical protein
MNWDMGSNYICPSVNNNYVHLNECVLQTNPSTTILPIAQTMKLSKKESNIIKKLPFKIIDNEEEIQQDGIGHTTSQQLINNTGTTKQNFTNFANTDLNGKCRICFH